MTNEELLKSAILKKYGSIHAFCVQNNLPNQSVTNIFNRGMGGTSINLLIKICKALNISLDALTEGKIERRIMDIHEVSKFDLELLTAYYEKEDLQEAVNILLGVTPEPHIFPLDEN